MSKENKGKLNTDGVVILDGASMKDISIEDMKKIIEAVKTTQELVDAYATVNNIWPIKEDETYDYEEGTEEYEKACSESDAWWSLLEELEKRAIKVALEEGLIDESMKDEGTFYKLERFMNKYGYYDGSGWWIEKDI
ncbi:MAG: hypothetical protein J5802_09060 [Butyrivibrio sp.]|nr:hypothetical protein [Butyrivibrio sp.]